MRIWKLMFLTLWRRYNRRDSPAFEHLLSAPTTILFFVFDVVISYIEQFKSKILLHLSLCSKMYTHVRPITVYGSVKL
ncbi:hypothetical protein Hanom_Chr10g00914801 [Helianthus anomalus]